MLYPARRCAVLLLLALGCEGSTNSGADGGAPAETPDSGGFAGGTGSWQALAPMPLPRYYVGVAAARNKVFVVGGFNGAEMVAVHIYDVASNSWSAAKTLPSNYRMPNAVGVGDRLFVLAGFENPASVEYDFANDAWIPRAPMPVASGRAGAAIGIYGNLALLAGGVVRGISDNALNTGRRHAELFAYDTSKDTWQQLSEVPVEVGYAMGGVIGDEFWIAGGSTNVSRIEDSLVYGIKTGKWASGPPLPKSVSSGAVGVIGGRLIITGGIATSIGMISRDTVVFDPAAKVWSVAAPLPTGRFGTGAAVVGNRLYVATGMGDNPGSTMNPFAAVPQLEVLSF